MLFDRPIEARDAGFVMPLATGEIRFVPAPDDRGEGLAAIDLSATDPEAVLKTARERGLPTAESSFEACGVRIQLVA